jgi:NADH-quinone oxidoreductase subunit N
VTLFLPEFALLIAAFLILALDLVPRKANSKNANPAGSAMTSNPPSSSATAPCALALAGLAAAAALLWQTNPGEALGGRFAVDGLDPWFKLIFIFSAALTLAFSGGSFAPRAQGRLRYPTDGRLFYPAEFHALLLFATAGMMFLASSRDLVAFYVSLELATIPLFLLSAWSKDVRSGEGALKYLLAGATASALLLYGLGLLYGLTGEMGLAAIGAKLAPNPALWLALAMTLAAVGFKLTLFPFHMWAPDAYEGAPPPVTAFLSVASKAAGLALFFSLYYRVMGPIASSLAPTIAILAAATMTLGNVVAIRQAKIKRFMAYSAISQAGYLLMGFLGLSHQSAAATVFYLFVYALTNLTAFAVIIHHIDSQGDEAVNGLRGLAKTSPLMALALMIALFGLAGIPPLSGFVGKFFLFSVAAGLGYYWLVAVAALNSTVSLYYYLRIVRQMYIEAPGPRGERDLPAPLLLKAGLGVACAGSVACGVIPMLYERIDFDAIHWLSALHLAALK